MFIEGNCPHPRINAPAKCVLFTSKLCLVAWINWRSLQHFWDLLADIKEERGKEGEVILRLSTLLNHKLFLTLANLVDLDIVFRLLLISHYKS